MKKTSLIMAIIFAITSFFGLGIGNAYAITYTSAQVALHNTAGDCWEIINNKVYNLTAFLALHSGGSAVITAVCGQNATATFNSGPHSASTITALNPYLLGDLGTTVVTPIFTTLKVTPANSTIQIGGTVQLSASALDQNGVALASQPTITWSSNNLSVATTSTFGLVRGATIGGATVTASATVGTINLSGTGVVTVTATSTPRISDNTRNHGRKNHNKNINHPKEKENNEHSLQNGVKNHTEGQERENNDD